MPNEPRPAAPLFDCTACPGICCSVYTEVNISYYDLTRLAVHFGLRVADAQKLYIKPGRGLELRRQQDPLLGETCVFFDTANRRCGVYEARPAVCRNWPRAEHAAPGAEGRCCYYDLYQYTKKEVRRDVLPLVQLSRMPKSK